MTCATQAGRQRIPRQCSKTVLSISKDSAAFAVLHTASAWLHAAVIYRDTAMPRWR